MIPYRLLAFSLCASHIACANPRDSTLRAAARCEEGEALCLLQTSLESVHVQQHLAQSTVELPEEKTKKLGISRLKHLSALEEQRLSAACRQMMAPMQPAKHIRHPEAEAETLPHGRCLTVTLVVLGALLMSTAAAFPGSKAGKQGQDVSLLTALPEVEEEQSTRLGGFARAMIAHRWAVILTWLAITAVGAVGAVRLQSILRMGFVPTRSMPARAANDHFEEVFPAHARGSDFALVLEVPAPNKILDLPGLTKFSFALRAALNETGHVVAFTSYATLLKEHGIDAKSQFVLDKGNMMLFQWFISDTSDSIAAQQHSKRAHKIIDQLLQPLPLVTFSGIVALPEVVNVSVVSAERYLGMMDGICLPIAGIVLMWLVRSVRLLVIPLMMLCAALASSFGAAFLLGHVTAIDSTTPALMMSILVAMNVDYSLFILTRFREELSVRPRFSSEAETVAQVRQAIATTMQTAGFTILTSGLMLLLTFLALICFPITVISSLGAGCGLALLLTLVLSLTLAPAALAAFPHFFAACVPAAAGRQKAYSPTWVWVSRVTTRFPQNALVLLALVLLTAGVGCSALRMAVQNDYRANVPRGTLTTKSFNVLMQNFGVGGAFPFKVMLEAPPHTTIFSSDFWLTSQHILREMAAVLPGRSEATQFNFISYVDGVDIPWAAAMECFTVMHAPQGLVGEVCTQLQYLKERFANPAGTAAWGYVRTSFDPMGREASAWLAQFRGLAQAWYQTTGIRITIVGAGADMADIVDKVYQLFPWMIVCTLSAMLVLLGVAFRSILIPLRAVLSICLTLTFVYGMAVLTYQEGMLNWTRVPGLTAEFHALPWISPVVCFSIVVGICLDYDIFLLSRITEFRAGKLNPCLAIQHGLCNTGGIISAAGVIMAVSFGGQLFSGLAPINCIGFFMTCATLYDTFLVRPLFTPAAMSLIGRYNWWPHDADREGEGKAAAPGTTLAKGK